MNTERRLIRWGIIGTGGIATEFVRDILGTGHQVTAVASRTHAKARVFADAWGIPAAYGSYEQLVAAPDVDVVYVATPHSRHHDDALLAVAAGKSVLVEKSFTQNAAQARAVAEAAASTGVFVMEAMWTRFLPHMVALRGLIADGAIGEVRTVIADHNQVLSTDPLNRILNPELAGGALLDLGIYPLSFAIDLLGLPTHIQASGTLTHTGVDRQTAVVLSHPGGAQSLTQSALDQPGPNTATVIGSDGYIVIDRVWYTPTSFTVFNREHEAIHRFEQAVPLRGMQFQADEVERCVTAGVASSEIMPLEQSVAIMEVQDEIRRQLGVTLPGDHWE